MVNNQSHGPALLDFAKSTGVHILNGRTLGDLYGNYTSYAHSGKPSVINYAMCSNHQLINSMRVNERTEHSIHCSISVNFRARMAVAPTKAAEIMDSRPFRKFYWPDVDSDNFRSALCLPSFADRLMNLSQETDVDIVAEGISNILSDVAEYCKVHFKRFTARHNRNHEAEE
jgi:hypothetical protein